MSTKTTTNILYSSSRLKLLFLTSLIFWLAIITTTVSCNEAVPLKTRHQQQGVKKFYNGDQVLRVFPATENQFNLLTQLLSGNDVFDEHGTFVDFWREPKAVGVPADLYVRRDKLTQIISFLDLAKIAHSVIVEDVQALIDQVEESDRVHRTKREAPTKSSGDPKMRRGPEIVGRYVSYSDMTIWMEAQCVSYPKLTECGTYGLSTEGRPLRYIRIGSQTASKNEKRSIFIESGMHGREWIAPASVIFIINKMLTGYQTDNSVTQLLDSYEFYIVPMTNPDGYEYSRTKERLWRKTRSNTSSPICYGVDGNRNYPVRWAMGGSETNPCSNIYHGSQSFSEPETKSLAQLIMAERQKWLAFFSIHSYSQFWLIPYGFAHNSYPKDYNELVRVANVGASALMAMNDGQRTWEVGNTVNLTYICSGSSDDWAKAIVGMKYSYTLELFPGSNALTGFVVGEIHIEPSGKEVFAGLVAAINEMKIPVEENTPDPIAFMTPEEIQVFNQLNGPHPNDDEEDEFSFTVNELQIILNKLALDLKSLMQRVDELDASYSASLKDLRERADRLEGQKFEAKLVGLDGNIDTLWKAVALTQSRQMSIQRHLLNESLILVVTPRFLPHTISKESLLGEIAKVAVDCDETVLEAIRKIDIEEISEIKVKTRPRVWFNSTSNTTSNITEDVYREFLLESRRFRVQRNVLLSEKAKNCTELAGYWFEPQISAEEKAIKRAIENHIHKLKIRHGDGLTYTVRGLKVTTNHGDYYYDTVSKKVFAFGTGRGAGSHYYNSTSNNSEFFHHHHNKRKH